MSAVASACLIANMQRCRAFMVYGGSVILVRFYRLRDFPGESLELVSVLLIVVNTFVQENQLVK